MVVWERSKTKENWVVGHQAKVSQGLNRRGQGPSGGATLTSLCMPSSNKLETEWCYSCRD